MNGRLFLAVLSIPLFSGSIDIFAAGIHEGIPAGRATEHAVSAFCIGCKDKNYRISGATGMVVAGIGIALSNAGAPPPRLRNDRPVSLAYANAPATRKVTNAAK